MFVVASLLLAFFLSISCGWKGCRRRQSRVTPDLDFPVFLLDAFSFKNSTWPVSRQPDLHGIWLFRHLDRLDDAGIHQLRDNSLAGLIAQKQDTQRTFRSIDCFGSLPRHPSL
jgi:hypothetical protein